MDDYVPGKTIKKLREYSKLIQALPAAMIDASPKNHIQLLLQRVPHLLGLGVETERDNDHVDGHEVLTDLPRRRHAGKHARQGKGPYLI